MISIRSILAVLSITLLPVTPVMAADIQDQIVEALREQGFTRIEIQRTWLGRLRFEASNGQSEREIVVNPKTGEILRDYQDSETRGLKPAFGFRPDDRRSDDRPDRPREGEAPPPPPEGEKPSGPPPDFDDLPEPPEDRDDRPERDRRDELADRDDDRGDSSDAEDERDDEDDEDEEDERDG
jgi:hypothetical protein